MEKQVKNHPLFWILRNSDFIVFLINKEKKYDNYLIFMKMRKLKKEKIMGKVKLTDRSR